MKREKLFRALGDVGDDLLHMAENRRFPNPWKKWASLAASLVLVVSLSLLALPYFPMGCGSSKSAVPNLEMGKEAASGEAADECPAEAPAEAPAEEIPAESAPAPETKEDLNETEAGAPEKGMTMVVYGGTYYYIRDWLTFDTITGEDGRPGDLGEKIGVVDGSTDESLIGCPVYTPTQFTWYTNHAVDGVAVPSDIYVQKGDTYFRAMTHNEKIVSRYTIEDVEEKLNENEYDFVLETFVTQLEAYGVGCFLDGDQTSEQMNRLYLASRYLNTGTQVDREWMPDEEHIAVPTKEIVWRLERFLDNVWYDTTETEWYDPALDCVVFPLEKDYSLADNLEIAWWQLSGDTLTLAVTGYGEPTGREENGLVYNGKAYMIRFDEDSWRYYGITPIVVKKEGQ